MTRTVAKRKKKRTPKQKAQLKRAQAISARKRRRGFSKKGVLKVGVGVGAVSGAMVAARKIYDRNHTYLYHSTSKEAHDSIKRSGFRKGHDYTGKSGGDTVYFSTNRQKNYGGHVIKLRVRKSDFRAHARRDPLQMMGHQNYYTLSVRQANRFLRGR